MNDSVLIGSAVAFALVLIIVERFWDRLPASHWITKMREDFRKDGGYDVGGGSCGDDGGDCGD